MKAVDNMKRDDTLPMYFDAASTYTMMSEKMDETSARVANACTIRNQGRDSHEKSMRSSGENIHQQPVYILP